MFARHGLIRALGALGIVLMLAACSGARALKEGQQLIDHGQVHEGLARLQDATRLEPGNAHYRIRLLTAREKAVQGLLASAATAVAEQAYDKAESLYKQVLALQGDQERALQGIRQIDGLKRWDRLCHEAQAALSQRRWDTARARLRTVLAEAPSHAQAIKLSQQLDREAAVGKNETALAGAYRRPITVEFKDASLRTLFEIISRSSGLNFVFDKEVKTEQRTSIYLRNSTIEAALQYVLLTNQLELRVLDANSVLIFPATQAKQKEYVPMAVRSFYLSNADAKTVSNTLKTIVKVKDVVVDDKLNLLIVRDSPEVLRLVEKLVSLHDVPDAEVMLEVEILEVKTTRLQDLGVNWPGQLTLTPLSSRGGESALTLADLGNLNASRIAASVAGVTVNARLVDGDANILANPRIRVRNREKARIMIGERVPNITTTATSTGFVSESVSYVDVGLKLEVEPVISPDDEVSIRISLEVSSLVSQIQTKSGTQAYRIGTRNATTVLRLQDGENQVLAGLISDEERRSGTRVPLLGQIPLLARLFGTQNDDTSKTEVVLSITPRILRNVVRPDQGLMEFDSGTEANSRGRSSEPAGNLAPQLGSASASDAGSIRRASPVGAASASAAPALPSPAGTQSPAKRDSTSSNTEPVAVFEPSWRGLTQLKTGDEFTLDLVQTGPVSATSMPFAVFLDPKALELVSISPGDLFKGGVFKSESAGDGRINVTATAAAGPIARVEAGSSLATLRLRLVAPPGEQALVQLLTLSALDDGGRPLQPRLPAPHLVRALP